MEQKTVLIADENHAAIEDLTTIMKNTGFADILQADNANDAWSTIRFRELGCIISAWDMQEMSGLALLRIVRSSDKFYDTPFFLTHSAFTEGMVIMSGQEGVTGLIVMPFDRNNIKNKMKALKFTVVDPGQAEAEQSLHDALDLIETGNFSTAMGILENLIEHEENAEYYYNIGYIQTAQGNYSEAIQAFRKATAIDRLFAKAYQGMGRAYQKLGKTDQAEKYMIKAADIHMGKENVHEAEDVLQEIKKMNPNTVNIYNSLGVLYRKKGDFKKALHNYKRALVIHPERVRIHYNIGRLYIEMKDPEFAKSYFLKALELEPDFVDAKEILEAIELGTFS